MIDQEKKRKRNRKYYQRNKEKILKKQREYKIKYHDTILAKNKIYNRTPAGKESKRRYNQTTKGKQALKRADKNRTRKLKTTIKVGKITVSFIRAKQKYYYIAECGNNKTQSEIYPTFKSCLSSAKNIFNKILDKK